MLTSTHLLAGAAIGKLTGNVYLAIPIAFFTHYLLDAVPHYNQKPVKNYKELGFKGTDKKDLLIKALEPAVGLALTAFLIFGTGQGAAAPLYLGAFFGWLPDFLVFLEWKHNIPRPTLIQKFEKAFHRHTEFINGILSQIIVSGIAIYVLLM